MGQESRATLACLYKNIRSSFMLRLRTIDPGHFAHPGLRKSTVVRFIIENLGSGEQRVKFRRERGAGDPHAEPLTSVVIGKADGQMLIKMPNILCQRMIF